MSLTNFAVDQEDGQVEVAVGAEEERHDERGSGNIGVQYVATGGISVIPPSSADSTLPQRKRVGMLANDTRACGSCTHNRQLGADALEDERAKGGRAYKRGGAYAHGRLETPVWSTAVSSTETRAARWVVYTESMGRRPTSVSMRARKKLEKACRTGSMSATSARYKILGTGEEGDMSAAQRMQASVLSQSPVVLKAPRGCWVLNRLDDGSAVGRAGDVVDDEQNT
ncbi:hypothetical protein HYPSUDRAFT_59323 [Hypholoma sublateritium FD-334 SS-4]|uniref:Uncharacterized protein n=1 Tax=Hypholoma sublateritium (strain FD-334 SS-4) TaxID=945553 RepID=A0A0D2LUP3_HYPSF|nr:hypothetical protein HYPSUDRAFT_59323 [Hypholoma sublateritium FD-334 SS-4]